LHAQNNLRFKTIITNDSVIQLDTLSISPLDFHLKSNNLKISIEDYTIDYSKALLYWNTKRIDTLVINYRVFNFNFNKSYSHKDTNILYSIEENFNQPIKYSLTSNSVDLFGSRGLNKSGSLSRGVLFGSSQDLSLNSNLNLQLSGKITSDIEILASITDDNLPIQPEGNTQQLNDFDQVYIQLFSKDKWKLQAGDFWLKKPKGYFINYNKRAQGASFYKKTNSLKNNKSFEFKNQASMAISKGKFARNTIQGIEGNQGPYKLIGAENEQFIIVLSGSEHVYIDGRELTRGTEYDYIIDYNTSEVSFTTNQIITKDKRIIVEFQYSDKNYARSIIESTNYFTGQKAKWYLNAYSEQDAKNQPLQQDLTTEERSHLSSIGDNLTQAYFPSFDSIEFNSNQVLYKKIDSLNYSNIYVQSNNSDSAFFQLSFSQVTGGGDYILNGFNAFGKIYKWIAPDTINNTIIHNGEYAPVRTLVTPQKKQIVSIGTEQQMNKNTLLKFESAMSNQDINTFSTLDNNDDVGFGFNFYLLNKRDSLIRNWSLISSLKAEVITPYFNPIERYRDIEFTRDWNIQTTTIPTLQTLAKGDITLKKGNQSFTFRTNTYQVDQNYEGYKNDIIINSKKNLNVFFNGSLLQSKSLENTNYLRHNSSVSKDFKKVTLGFKDIHERNNKVTGDSLSIASYQFYDWKTYISTRDTTNAKIELFYGERYDKKAQNNQLSPTTFARNPGLKVDYSFNQNHQIKWTTTYRMLTIKDTSLTNIQPENTLLNRINHRIKILKGGLSFSTFYEIGSGLELKKEFSYIEVIAGQGVYTWIDYNDDGIKDINEFEVAVFSDQASYIRVFTPSQDYVKTFNNSFNEVVNINPRYFLKKENRTHKFINRFSSQTALRTNRKTTLDQLEGFANPFTENIADSSLQTLNNSFRNSIYFNRSNPRFGIEHIYIISQNKTLLASGFDARSRKSNGLNTRWNITKSFLIQLKSEFETKEAAVDYASNRNYLIASQLTEGKLSYQPSTKFRLSVIAKYTDKQNQLASASEKAFINNYGLELKYNQLKKGIITASFNYINNVYIGEENSTIAFELLDALQPGINYTWNCSIQRTLANNLQLTLNYNGRDSDATKTIHTGGVQVRAFF
jgi:hypothetical protein